jgi:hypothetical protein
VVVQMSAGAEDNWLPDTPEIGTCGALPAWVLSG